jgi:hypothetical protein
MQRQTVARFFRHEQLSEIWHGGGLTGVTYETTPDGRPGWLQNFVLNGWTIYNSDAMERGRSGFPPPN